jgi:hypothetical protein
VTSFPFGTFTEPVCFILGRTTDDVNSCSLIDVSSRDVSPIPPFIIVHDTNTYLWVSVMQTCKG